MSKLEKRIEDLEKALREVDDLRHEMKEIMNSLYISNSKMRKLVFELKKPCMVLYDG